MRRAILFDLGGTLVHYIADAEAVAIPDAVRQEDVESQDASETSLPAQQAFGDVVNNTGATAPPEDALVEGTAAPTRDGATIPRAWWASSA